MTSSMCYMLGPSRYEDWHLAYGEGRYCHLKNVIWWCGSLNEIGSHNLIGSGTIKKYGFVGVSVALLKEVWHCGGGWAVKFPVHRIRPIVSVNFLLPARCRSLSYFSSTMSAACCHAPHYDDNGLNLWNCKGATPIKCSLYKSCCGHGVPSQQ